jgi:CspA family cold shock protein
VVYGKIAEFNSAKGLGYIEPDGGGPKVLVHADEWGGDRNIDPGTPVRFATMQGSDGLRAYNVMILGPAPMRDSEGPTHLGRNEDAPESAGDAQLARGDSSDVQILDFSDYVQEITDVVTSVFPGGTMAQIVEACSEIAMRAAKHGWLVC